MTYKDIISLYGSAPEAAKKLGISRQLLYRWREFGIPRGRQALIHFQTNGRLKADPSIRVPK